MKAATPTLPSTGSYKTVRGRITPRAETVLTWIWLICAAFVAWAQCFYNSGWLCMPRDTCPDVCATTSCYEPSLGIWVNYPTDTRTLEDAWSPSCEMFPYDCWDFLHCS
ncbi:hypothetical protein [Limisphaera sp. 4302-co]|uniref:hypothetical protein n=1 Tax=Limisphaera sp. 4302-co TaxID=3400417 RepID=UPI003C29B243